MSYIDIVFYRNGYERALSADIASCESDTIMCLCEDEQAAQDAVKGHFLDQGYTKCNPPQIIFLKKPVDVNELPMLVLDNLNKNRFCDDDSRYGAICIHLSSALPCEAYMMSLVHLVTDAKVVCGDKTTLADSLGKMILRDHNQLKILETFKDAESFTVSDVKERKVVRSAESKRVNELLNRGLLDKLAYMGDNNHPRAVNTKGHMAIEIANNLKYIDRNEGEK